MEDWDTRTEGGWDGGTKGGWDAWEALGSINSGVLGRRERLEHWAGERETGALGRRVTGKGIGLGLAGW